MLAEESPDQDSAPERSAHPAFASCDDPDLNDQIERLHAENAALMSVLSGLCIGLSQISEVNRAIVAQALDNADRFVASGELGVAGAFPAAALGRRRSTRSEGWS
jgi:hypothetical protein